MHLYNIEIQVTTLYPKDTIFMRTFSCLYSLRAWYIIIFQYNYFITFKCSVFIKKFKKTCSVIRCRFLCAWVSICAIRELTWFETSSCRTKVTFHFPSCKSSELILISPSESWGSYAICILVVYRVAERVPTLIVKSPLFKNQTMTQINEELFVFHWCDRLLAPPMVGSLHGYICSPDGMMNCRMEAGIGGVRDSRN